jgi:GH24 family phage-related lysozyme (muramidase)
MLDTNNYLPKLKEFEGMFSHMYLDTTGNVTVGVGKLLADAAAAQKLAFVHRSDASAKAATPEEIRADFETVNKQAGGKLASYYKQFTRLDLPESAIDALLDAEVRSFMAGLSKAFPEFDSYPSEACAAIFDMAYNLGLGALTSGFPTFCRAVRNRDWATAAKECHRGGIGEGRNNWTRDQLLAAARNAPAQERIAGRESSIS